MSQDLVPIVEICFLFVYIPLKLTVKLAKNALVFLNDFKLRQVVAYLLAVPALGLSDLVYNHVSSLRHILELRLRALLAVDVKRGDTEIANLRVVVFCDKLNLLFRKLVFADERKLLIAERCHSLVISQSDHAVIDYEALIGHHLTVSARDHYSSLAYSA